MHISILIENISFSRNCDIKMTNAKSVTDASIWEVFVSKYSALMMFPYFRKDSPESRRRRYVYSCSRSTRKRFFFLAATRCNLTARGSLGPSGRLAVHHTTGTTHSWPRACACHQPTSRDPLYNRRYTL